MTPPLPSPCWEYFCWEYFFQGRPPPPLKSWELLHFFQFYFLNKIHGSREYLFFFFIELLGFLKILRPPSVAKLSFCPNIWYVWPWVLVFSHYMLIWLHKLLKKTSTHFLHYNISPALLEKSFKIGDKSWELYSSPPPTLQRVPNFFRKKSWDFNMTPPPLLGHFPK